MLIIQKLIAWIRTNWGLAAFMASVLIVPIAPFALIVGSDTVRNVRERLNRLSFVSAQWKDPTLVGPPGYIRLRMVDDLLGHDLLARRTREQVLELLGPPDHVDAHSSSQIVYFLGPERGFISIDSEWLSVEFGPDGTCRSAGIFRD